MPKYTGAPYWPVWLLAGAALGILLAIGVPWPKELVDQTLWVGENGILGVLVSAATLVGVVAAARGVQQNAVHARAERSSQDTRDSFNRFESAVALLASDKQSSQRAGVAIIEELAAEKPSKFGHSGVSVLSHFVTDVSKPIADQTRKFLFAEGDHPDFFSHETCGGDALTAMGRIAKITGQTSMVLSPVLVLSTFNATHLGGFRLSNAIFNRALFDKCEMRGTIIQALFSHELSFDDCDLHSAEFYARSHGDDQIAFSFCDMRDTAIEAPTRQILLRKCDISGARIDVDRIVLDSCWSDPAALPEFSVGAEQGDIALPVFARTTNEGNATERGFIVYECKDAQPILVSSNPRHEPEPRGDD